MLLMQRRAWPVRFKALIYCISTNFFKPTSSKLSGKRNLFLADKVMEVIAKLPDTAEYAELKNCVPEYEDDIKNILHNYRESNFGYQEAEAEAMYAHDLSFVCRSAASSCVLFRFQPSLSL